MLKACGENAAVTRAHLVLVPVRDGRAVGASLDAGQNGRDGGVVLQDARVAVVPVEAARVVFVQDLKRGAVFFQRGQRIPCEDSMSHTVSNLACKVLCTTGMLSAVVVVVVDCNIPALGGISSGAKRNDWKRASALLRNQGAVGHQRGRQTHRQV